MNRVLYIVMLLVVVCAPLCAQDAQAKKMVITSDRMEFDYQRTIAQFKGNVEVNDADIRIKSEQLTVIFGQGNNIRAVTAWGNVRIWQGDKKATCRRAVYSATKREVTLTGDATVTRGTDLLTGDVITFWIDEERMVCEPGYLQIIPKKERASRDLLRE